MISYSQRDPHWANDKIKGTKLTIGRFGCVITSIADLSTYFYPALTPHEVNNKVKFTKDGLIIWASCNFDNFIFAGRERGANWQNIKRAIKDPYQAVILEVANGSHWVVATGWTLWGNSFKIADPWIGDRATMARYDDDITGAAYFQRK